MLLNSKAFVVARAAGPDVQSMNCLRIETDGSTVATDGKLLFRFIPDAVFDPKDYPAFDGLAAVDGKEKLKPFYLSVGSARAILKVLPKEKRLPQPVMKSIVLDVAQTNQGKYAVLGFTDFKRAVVIRPEKLDQQFPDYSKVFPKQKAKLVIAFRTDIFRRALEILSGLEVEAFTLFFRGPTTAVEIRARTSEKDGKVVGLVMPFRLEEETGPQKPKAKDKPKKKLPEPKK